MNTWLASTRDTFKTQLWPVPAIAVVAAPLLGVGVPQLDAAVDGALSGRVNDWLFGGDADAARSLLGAIASSLITVTAHSPMCYRCREDESSTLGRARHCVGGVQLSGHN